MASLFLFGLGYSTAAIARQAQAADPDCCVTSTAREPRRFAQLAGKRHAIVAFDPAAKRGLDERGLAALQRADYVLTCIPPLAAKLYDPVLAAQHRLLRELAAGSSSSGGSGGSGSGGSSGSSGPAGLGYLSSTGVYGDWAGAWVDEACEPRTATGRGLLRLEAELAWRCLAEQLGLPLTVFRLGGIYGPRRGVLDSLRAQAAPGPNAARRGRQRFTSRCHVADVAQAVLADAARRLADRQQQQGPGLCQAVLPLVDVVNVVDDEPAPRGEVEAHALQLLGREPAPAQQREADSSSSSSSDGSSDGNSDSSSGSRRGPRRGQPLEEKRVANAKLRALLASQGRRLLAPSYREGLALLAAGDTAPFAPKDLGCLFAPASCWHTQA